jgi:hypothetical protein
MRKNDDELRSVNSQEDMVFTPGGPRPRKKVHMLDVSQEHGSRGDGVVIPPGGPRQRASVHRVASGFSAAFSGLSKLRLRHVNAPGPPDAANWITCAGWLNGTGKPITKFTTTWKVPPEPSTVASQLIYLFNGIEPADGQTIVQPVLQWGDSGPDDDGQNRTGQYWTAACWIVGGSDNSATHTPHIRVNPGDVLIGVVTLVSESAAGFVYSCEFQGLAGAMFLTPSIPELVWCVETLEAYELQGNHIPPYDLNALSEYPASQSISFENINIITDNPAPNGTWQVQNFVSQFGEHSSVIVDVSSNGEIVIFF